jgi:hypothetical protein
MSKEMRRGRPPKTLGEPKRAQFNTRLRPSLKKALDADAQANGRSLSEEIEFRLERSFSEEARARDLREMLALALGAEVAALTLTIGLALRDVVRWAQPSHINLLSNAFLHHQGREAILRIIDIVKPHGDPMALPGGGDTLPGTEASAKQWRALGPTVGTEMWWRIVGHPEHLGPWGSSIQEWLGPDVIERIRAEVEA